jgi:hypothetical protein
MAAAPTGPVDSLCSMCGGELPYGHRDHCPYGKIPDGVSTMASVAAPMLAGFTIALAGVVAQAAEKFRWPSAALLLLAISAIFLINAVQAGFWSQRPVALEKIRFWRAAASFSYDAGIVMLLVGLAVVLAPPSSADAVRWAATSACLAAAIGETVWSVVSRRDRVGRGRSEQRRSRA